ncbi:MAG TPA: hypothetical protein VM783_17930 [Candidatus Acidoferrum sp.]|nr:hypothetical protein [Candidatus Acidoferrum sp.]
MPARVLEEWAGYRAVDAGLACASAEGTLCAFDERPALCMESVCCREDRVDGRQVVFLKVIE